MLLKLPNELVFQVFDELEGADLFALAKSCRRLNIIATSCYLSRHHPANPHLLIDLDKRNFHILPFLRISVQLTSTNDIYCIFTTRYYLNEIRGLERLLLKLSSVRCVHLSLEGTLWSPADEVHFLKAIRRLLTDIIARSCETLQICHDPRLLMIYTNEQKVQHIPSSNHASTFIASLRRMLRKSSPTNDIYDTVLPGTFHTSKLTNLWVSSISLLNRPFLQWTTKLIEASPIDCLTFRNSHLTFFPWDDLFSDIHCTTLSQFFIQDHFHQISLSSVSAFLARHQDITSLECQGLFRDDYKPQKLFLPQLTKLASCCGSIVHILEDVTAFPSLRKIFLNLYPCKCSRLFDPTAMNNALACVARCPNEIKLFLEFNQDDDALLAWLDVDVNDKSRIERSLDHVVGLTLGAWVLPRSSRAQSILVFPKWISLFPALRLLTYQSYRPDDRASQLKFAHSVIQNCSQLETLTINEEIHTVTTWLAMKD